jgi:peptidoglycan/xylan/chitin deacetylase (PgdA/CDA1 family)
MFFFKKSPWIVRRISGTENEIYLTFDDGPTSDFTPQVLDLLKAKGALATFFVIGAHAKAHPELVKRMLREGHAVMSHSLDHRYDLYFKNANALKTWIEASLAQLSADTGQNHKTFRPPAGILTPPLLQAAAELKTPLLLWSQRFFDTNLQWTLSKALKSAQGLIAGDIVLLHDRQKIRRQDDFLETLATYLHAIGQRGYLCRPLSEALVQKQVENLVKT